MVHPTSPAEVRDTGRLFPYWQAEAVRLREAHWGPLEDRAACQAALHQPAELDRRILVRAAWLAGHGGLADGLRRWSHGARWALAAIWGAAILAGIGTASSVLGQPQGSVNLALALIALLGLHLLTLMIWLAGFLPGIAPSTALSRLWLWLTQRLARGPDGPLAAQALLSLLHRARAGKLAVGLISHGAWTLAFLGMLPTLVLLLSTRRYTFHWETTLLSPDAFIGLTRVLGWLPRALGFPAPAATDIAASVGLQPLPAAIQADWSLWLIGCVIAWGLLPRLLALIACAVGLRRRLRRLRIDPDLPGWLELRERLLPTHEPLGVDRPAWTPARPTQVPAAANGPTGAAAILGFELGTGLDWPPHSLPTGIRDLGRCDSRADRARIRDALRHAPAHLLLVCDARLTPDRGTRAWFEELQRLCPALRVLCLDGTPSRLPAWREFLASLGLTRVDALEDWLARIRESRHD